MYWNPYGSRLRATVGHHLRAVCGIADPSRVLAINAIGGVPSSLRFIRPRAVILHTTFLAIRWLQPFEKWRARTSWLEGLDVPKIALPQDDYDHSDTLDEWLAGLGTTDVLTTFPHATELYTRTRLTARLHFALTGYVDECEAARWTERAGVLDRRRPLDLVYRASHLPYWYGRLGQMKADIGIAARRVADSAHLVHDISLEGVITGRDWFDYLASGRLVVGAESGSSVLDRTGKIRARVAELLREDPSISFSEVSAAMPTGWDGHWFAALSPRHLEAAVTRTAQVLVEGEYSGVLRPGRHYVPVRSDLSNLADAIDIARDPRIAEDLTSAAHADLVESGLYDYRRLTELIRGLVPDPDHPVGPIPRVLSSVSGRAHSAVVSCASALSGIRKREDN